MEPEERAAAGLFLAFQYPVEIPGVGNMTFLRTALNAQRKARGEEEISAGDFLKLVREKAKTLKIDAEMLKRPVNVGFSGGEKKRNEILQMAMLEPKMCILDETDSGLDVDAMKLVSDGVNALRDAGRGFLVITHYQRLLDHIKPDVVHIMAGGRIVKTGGPELALEVEQERLCRHPERGGVMAVAQAKQDLTEARIGALDLPRGGAWANAARDDALARLRAMGLPNRRDEYWKFTDPTSLTQVRPRRARPCSRRPTSSRSFLISTVCASSLSMASSMRRNPTI
jgi:FeS assembly ATPase SufC